MKLFFFFLQTRTINQEFFLVPLYQAFPIRPRFIEGGVSAPVRYEKKEKLFNYSHKLEESLYHSKDVVYLTQCLMRFNLKQIKNEIFSIVFFCEFV